MNKLYHAFCVFSYKGGDLSYDTNLTLEALISKVLDIDWEDIFDTCADDEKFSHMEDDEYFSLSRVQLVDMMDNKTIRGIFSRIIYPGNLYAFDSRSDYEIFTTDSEGKLIEVDIVEEPGFLELARKALKENAESWDNRHKS